MPALSRLPGQSPAQLDICSAVGKGAISIPVSARNRRCSQLSDSRHRLEQRESVLKWCHPHALENFGIQDFQLFLQASEMTQRTTNQESLVVSHPMPLHCFD